jgi:hypothetical protein
LGNDVGDTDLERGTRGKPMRRWSWVPIVCLHATREEIIHASERAADGEDATCILELDGGRVARK